MTAFRAAALLLATLGAGLSADERALVTRDVFLMGTKATLSVQSGTRAEGLAALDRALAELVATDSELSTWRDDSAISRLNRQPVGQPWQLEPSLCGLFDRIDRWHQATGGAFDPAIGTVVNSWDIHGDGRVPDPTELARAREHAGWNRLTFNRITCEVVRLGPVSIDVGAFGKGEALDRAGQVLGTEIPWLLNLGGQILVNAAASPDTPGWTLAIAHPQDRQLPFLNVRIGSGSLATSAGSERDHLVDGNRVGHILDPRTSRPARFQGSVTVWHPQALTADILSTALYVMGPEQGLAWARQERVAVCYLIPDATGLVSAAMTEEFRVLVSGRE